jgi:hypothetical protein
VETSLQKCVGSVTLQCCAHVLVTGASPTPHQVLRIAWNTSRSFLWTSGWFYGCVWVLSNAGPSGLFPICVYKWWAVGECEWCALISLQLRVT